MIQRFNPKALAKHSSEFSIRGFVIIRNLLTPEEVNIFSEECDRLLNIPELIHEDNWRSWFRKTTTGEKLFEKLDPAIDISPLIRKLTCSKNIISIVSEILKDEVLLFKDKLIFKPPRQNGYSLHQDYAWWQEFNADDLCSVLISLDYSDISNGGVEFFPECHKQLLTPIGEERSIFSWEFSQLRISQGELIALHPGDAVVFHSLCPHRSGENQSLSQRRHIYLTYSAARIGDQYQQQQKMYRESLKNRTSMSEKEVAQKFFR
ncbi:MAG: phytanoyl-CoA dioxygenase family protein [Kastovskya adunca ATA6-11-RM4]|jgi:ectoine hydroxylase-related dioxygenase (phytanoyl-CoA dioxygenase family)|nr:phytanoyl-CoA dioxygenase family protein [Kastovskya adunca ATA6-11-RM4]